MSATENFSQILVDISGELLQSANNMREMQSRLDIVVIAWNISLHSRKDRPLKLKRFIRKQKDKAPSKEALKSLEAEIKNIIKHKLNLYPNIDTELVRAEAVETGKDSYEIKVYFKDKEEEAKMQQAQLAVTNFNKAMSERD